MIPNWKTSLLLIAVLAVSCKSKTTDKSDDQMAAATVVGETFDRAGAEDVESLALIFEDARMGDTLQGTFKVKVKDVCQMKGCWMTVELPGGEEARITFKDYGFFVPKDLGGKEVIINGKAFVETTTVEDRKHLAADAGKSEEEIALIDSPVKTFAFEAEGVAIPE
ncbi:DUF4920 domain-containing protein [Robertkochia aurantiaca]|uniref:DUF4920 domain-containing protein n=1 Tax=Robertkochia aurantiaca TaxID=2873700 RepID=UPI001CCA9793|nr:DUF4920 domain-containing protein [Robertkochia sp. 3YJGBD-33]